MKKSLYVLLILGFLFNLNAYEKKSIVERFTNASCAPCASINNAWYNTLTANMLGSGTISHIVYNGWWPGAGDPMYILNQADNTTRINYYGVNAVPWIVANGVTVSTSSSALTNAVNTGNSQYSPFKIIISQRALSNNLIELGIKVFTDPSDTVSAYNNLKLKVGLTEKSVNFQSPPGSNGESHFFSVCRKMLPNAGGTTLTAPAPGDSTEIILQYTPTSAFLQSVNLDSLRVVAFIQNETTKGIYQSTMMEAIPNFVAAIIPSSPDVISSGTTPSQFSSVIRNIGMMADTYSINCTFDGPGGWTGNYTTINGTKAFGDIDLVQVLPGDSTVIDVTLNPNSIGGFGTVSVQFESTNNPGYSGSTSFRLITSGGVDVLVVDASGGGYGEVIYNSLGNVYSGTAGMISREAVQSPTADLSDFKIITWSAGNAVPVLTTDEVTKLQNYLDQNGQLLLNGQDIGADIFEVTGQSQHAQSFYNTYLHATYEQNIGPSFLIQGFDGDLISDGMLFFLNDVYSKSPDHISAIDADAVPIFRFGNGTNPAGLRVTDTDYRLLYLAFGIEQINDSAVKDSLVARSMRWLTDGIVLGVDDNNTLPRVFSLEQNYPNPFNPSTVINYQIPAAGKVVLKVYDLLGKEVATLVNGNQDAGYYSAAFDASNLSSSIYFYTLTSGEYTSTKKMTLVK